MCKVNQQTCLKLFFCAMVSNHNYIIVDYLTKLQPFIKRFYKLNSFKCSVLTLTFVREKLTLQFEY